MKLEIDDGELKHGLLGLVMALVEIIRDTLRIESVKRMEGGRLTEEQVERLGNALIELDRTIDKIKEEQGVSEAVRSVRDGLDDLVNQMVHAVGDTGGDPFARTGKAGSSLKSGGDPALPPTPPIGGISSHG
jgi:predicted GTPase